MSDSIVAKIGADPKYHELRRKRTACGWTLCRIDYFGEANIVLVDSDAQLRRAEIDSGEICEQAGAERESISGWTLPDDRVIIQ